MRDFIASYLVPLIYMALLGLGSYTVRLLARRWSKTPYWDISTPLRQLARMVVANLEQTVVADLKDPNKPGTWTKVAADAAKKVAVETLQALGKAHFDSLDPTVDRVKFAENLIEEAVHDLHPKSAPGFARFGVMLLVAGLAIFGLHFSCSASQNRQVAVGMVATAGGIVSGLYTANRISYHAGCDALRAQVQGSAYDARVGPLNAVYRARGDALGVLNTCLYSGAADIDAASDGTLNTTSTARTTLSCWNAALPVLQDGSVLPPVILPPGVAAFTATLQGLAGGAQ